MKTIVAVLLVVGCGCGSVSPPVGPGSDAAPGRDATTEGGGGSGTGPDQYRSGTRIKMQTLTTPDGAKQFVGWFDTERNEACQFSTAADGVTRCLPTPMAIRFTLASSTTGLFADMACTVFAVDVSAPQCPDLHYIAVAQALTCPPSGLSVYRATTSTTRYFKNGATCTATAIPTNPIVYAADGSEVAPSAFQSAALGTE